MSSLKDRFAKPKTTTFSTTLDDGTDCNIDLRELSGANSILEVRKEWFELQKVAKSSQVDLSNTESLDGDKHELLLDLHESLFNMYLKLLEKVVILPPDEEAWSRDDWINLTTNVGGLNSEFYKAVFNAAGLGEFVNTLNPEEGGEDDSTDDSDLPFSSAES